MALPVVYRDAARQDIVAAARQYEGHRRGLGAAFVSEVARIEAHIADAPGLYQSVEGEVRRAVMRRFPFGVFYIEEAARIVVLACLDLRQDPPAIGRAVERR